MAIRNIARMGNPILRQRAQKIPPDRIQSPEVQRLIDDMIETMAEYEGVGLAAPQVHESVRLFIIGDVYDPADDDRVLLPAKVIINPEITFLTQDEQAYWEGCLSIPDLRGLVPRPREIRLNAYDRDGKKIEVVMDGFAATVIQHEYDHLDGVLFVDRMPDMTKLSFNKEFSRYIAAPPEEVAD